MMKFKELVDLFHTVKTAVGLIPSVGAVINDHLWSVIPITPLLRPYATLVTVICCVVAIGCALSFAKDLSPDIRGKRLRPVAVWSGIIGVVLLGLYLVALSLMQSYPASLPAIVTLLDVIQVGLFAAPFVAWTVAVVVSVSLIRA